MEEVMEEEEQEQQQQQQGRHSKLEFFDEMEEEEDDGKKRNQELSLDIRVHVHSCRKQAGDWIYDIKVGVAHPRAYRWA